MTIYFYSTIDKYGCFSNFSRHGFQLDDKYWPTSEHYFQAQKFLDTDISEKIRTVSTPKKAAQLGRRRDFPLRDDWEQIKDEVMYKAVLKKFQTHQDIRDVLLGTGSEELVENARGDYYWGCGADGSGKNMLGKILQRVRKELQ